MIIIDLIINLPADRLNMVSRSSHSDRFRLADWVYRGVCITFVHKKNTRSELRSTQRARFEAISIHIY